MFNMTLEITASRPSFGMPVFGAASSTPACSGTRVESRDRRFDAAAVVTADVVAARADKAVAGAIPGTHAWRPPVC